MMSRTLIAGMLLSLAFIPAASATQICSWLVETNKPDDVLMLDVWVEADADYDFYYQIGGKGMVDGSSKMHSPGSGTFSVDKGKPVTMWGIGATFNPPGTIDVIVEIHQKASANEAMGKTPLLTQFAFHRAVPAGEKKAPKTLAKKQCATVK